jgi:hypothetical protein
MKVPTLPSYYIMQRIPQKLENAQTLNWMVDVSTKAVLHALLPK